MAGWSIDPPARRDLRPVVWFAAAGVAADFDLLVGAHSGPTHGLGTACLVGLASWLILQRTVKPGSVRSACALAVAYASHTLLDWLGTDSSPPIGIMALWPFSRDYYESHLHVFRAISRRYWLPEFWTSNLTALGGELLILVPLALLVLALRRRAPATTGA